MRGIAMNSITPQRIAMSRDEMHSDAMGRYGMGWDGMQGIAVLFFVRRQPKEAARKRRRSCFKGKKLL
jgi:hypothetical protein